MTIKSVERQLVADEVWQENYRGPEDQSLEDTWQRQAMSCAAVESEDKRDAVLKDFQWLLSDFHGIAGGRITANLGISGRGATTLYNCFVFNPADVDFKDSDSIEGIYDMLKYQAHTLKSEGGYGMNFSWIRPNGSYVVGIDSRTPGVLNFMELWDTSSKIITMGSEKMLGGRRPSEKKKIRKGAQMGILECWHPEIEDFIDAKLVEGRLSKFNISVGVTEGFMDAVLKDKDWDLKFPDTEFEKYNTEWFGNIYNWESKGYPVFIYKTVKARDLWEKIIKSTYTRNDPGVLFFDTVNKLNPLAYAERVVTTNPCFSGDTLVAVADGRNYVSIEQLAEEGKDVPVYSVDNKTGKVSIQWGRNPRVTGTAKDLLRVTLDDGSHLDVTPDHKFTLLDGTKKEAKDLVSGDSLPRFKKVEEPVKKGSKPYYMVYGNVFDHHKGKVFEHRLIAKFYHGNEWKDSERSFQSYSEVKEAGANYNHKVLKIEKLDGKHNVYNITVDYNHNLAVITDVEQGNQTGVFVDNCGEISMSTGVCLLFSFNLIKYIKKDDNGKFVFDFETFKKAVRIGTRFADNINDISRTPLPAYKKAILEKRRLGLGVLSLGSLHYCLGIKFGSKESLELTKEIFKVKAETEILASAELGKEKGSFKLFDRDKYFNSYWWKNLPISDDVKKQVEQIGEMRNSHRSANAPTGNMSIYAGVVSGGIEPVFMKEYSRWSIVPEIKRKALRERGFEFPDIFVGEWFETKHLKAKKIGTDDVLKGTFENEEYQVDKNRGLTRKTNVEDWGWAFVKSNYSEEEIVKMESDGVFCTTDDLTVQDHINMLEVIAPFVDQNSSKTINVPADYSYEDFKNVYFNAWKAGIKGVTTYRAGTMTAVLESQGISPEMVDRSAPKRPKELPCEIHRPKIKGKEWAVIVGLYETRPYEIFAGPISNLDFPSKGVGIISKKKRGVYSLITESTKIENIIDYFDDDDSAWATRMVSMSLRHGIPLKFIYDQLSKDGFITDVNKVLARILKKYVNLSGKINCPQCDSENVVLEEGCLRCLECNFGKCG